MKTPFTAEQFLNVFEKYNAGIYPYQWILFFVGCTIFILLHFHRFNKLQIVYGYVAVLWIWAGAVYFINFLSEITGAGFVFGICFILQGCFIIHHLIFDTMPNISARFNLTTIAAYIFILFALLGYPLIEYLKTGSQDSILFIGLPCPTALLTLGLFMMSRSGLPKSLLPIPTAWAVISLVAAMVFGMYQDLVLLVAAIIINSMMWKQQPVKSVR